MLEIKDLSLKFEDKAGNEIEILKNINLKLDKKKIYVLTGPNGSGKSSLAKVIMGIYKATTGKLILDGEDITDLGITERAKQQVGFAFQQPPRFKGIKVRELLHLAGGDKKIDPCELLLNVGLCANDYMDREVDSSLSGGELKRIEIASVICRDSKVVVFDEPEAGIDLWSFRKLAETFQRMHEQKDTTIIIISHQERIIKLADEVIVLNNGMIREITSKEEILDEISRNESISCSLSCDKGVV
ncbi:MAG: ABC transporter ATP-binding protein [Solirubrobacterales bacterium]